MKCHAWLLLLLAYGGPAAAEEGALPPADLFSLECGTAEAEEEYTLLLRRGYPALLARLQESFDLEPSSTRPYRVLVVDDAVRMRGLQSEGGLREGDTLLGGFVNPITNDAILMLRPFPGHPAGPRLPLGERKAALHEAVHQIFYRTTLGRSLPWWYREGVADLWADRLLAELHGVSWCRMSHLPHARAALTKGELSLRRLLQIDRADVQGPPEYAAAWSLLAMLERRFPALLRRYEVALLARATSRGRTPPPDLLEMCPDPEAIEAAWHEFIRTEPSPWFARGAMVGGDASALWLGAGKDETAWLRLGGEFALDGTRITIPVHLDGTSGGIALYVSDEDRTFHLSALAMAGERGFRVTHSLGGAMEGVRGALPARAEWQIELRLERYALLLAVDGGTLQRLAMPAALPGPLRIDAGVYEGIARFGTPRILIP